MTASAKDGAIGTAAEEHPPSSSPRPSRSSAEQGEGRARSDGDAQKAESKPSGGEASGEKSKKGNGAGKQPDPRPAPAQAKPPAATSPGAGPTAEARALAAAANKELLLKIRRERSRRLAIRFGIFVILPTLVAAIYYGFVASDQYESYAQVTVHSAELGSKGGLEGLLSPGLGLLAVRDTLVVRDHIRSRDMLARLDKEHGFIEHYKQKSIDLLSRADADATLEEMYEDYEEAVNVELDTTSGNLSLRVRAFSADKAVEFARAILAYSEEMVNLMSERERQDRTKYAEDEVKTCEARLAKARRSLLEQQRKHAELDPRATASSAMSIRTALEGELARARAELMEAKSVMKDDAPKVRALRDRVKAISAQVGHEKNRLVDANGENGLADSLAEFDEAMVEKEFAQKAYESALAALEMAKADAARQHRYLAVIAAPSLPDESTFPKRGLGVLTVFIVSFLLLGIGSLLVAAVREHAQV